MTPFSDIQVLDEIGRPGKTLRSQEKLVVGMLRPSNLLDILRNFILFTVDEGVLIKICSRYQQYRAVQKAMVRLIQGNTKEASNNTKVAAILYRDYQLNLEGVDRRMKRFIDDKFFNFSGSPALL